MDQRYVKFQWQLKNHLSGGMFAQKKKQEVRIFLSSSGRSIAFVLINVETGTETDVIKELRKIEGATEVHFVYGVYDVLVKVEGRNQQEVKETITERIRRLNNVRTTLTMMVVAQ
jgi:DNA-binding Lrp family transcriptional regulator